ncbi:hypothetical protein CNMCM8980_002855 [Aspergillus fumigatiaffinis]|uniref:AT hook motif protein n=1 Tax=Aspergillus fumigatiaffinis TaxID=340414 RepID=A0A8H4M1H6_9EURO|nr:hypothetical protein CNMCM5878_010522 [Aspergillus fumigatiaffinis]KAF4225655.1 hypothetical protein CNMCM6457_007819 [Aspergillus fumigatiaffinis]KAF4241421.1 hypothetical protein CNMCM6805_004079 [Aspergillus fumigatiaffinis]KAF4249749.1 hypothetical protein CNMCM8980_002855 [Aspergillus fumigatiaffinis]
MPMTWDHETDAKLLLGIIATSNVKPDYEALAKYMGPDCTVYAIQHRIRKLKTDAGAVTTADVDSSTPATPEKRKRGRPKKDTNGDGADKDKASPKKAKKEENGSAVDSA